MSVSVKKSPCACEGIVVGGYCMKCGRVKASEKKVSRSRPDAIRLLENPSIRQDETNEEWLARIKQ